MTTFYIIIMTIVVNILLGYNKCTIVLTILISFYESIVLVFDIVKKDDYNDRIAIISVFIMALYGIFVINTIAYVLAFRFIIN